MKKSGRIEDIKKVGKRLKKACPVDLKLAYAHSALARALDFENWHELVRCLEAVDTAEFTERVMKISSDPSHPTFLAAVKRFADSSGVDLDVANALCFELLPPALDRWRYWKDRSNDRGNSQWANLRGYTQTEPVRVFWERVAERSGPVVAVTSSSGIKLISAKAPVSVVVRKKRQIVPPCSSAELKQ